MNIYILQETDQFLDFRLIGEHRLISSTYKSFGLYFIKPRFPPIVAAPSYTLE